MDALSQSFFNGIKDGVIEKAAGAVAGQAAQAVRRSGAGGKLMQALSKRPALVAATAAAGGAGAAHGVAEAKKKKEKEDRRREQIRQLLMRRLSGYGY